MAVIVAAWLRMADSRLGIFNDKWGQKPVSDRTAGSYEWNAVEEACGAQHIWAAFLLEVWQVSNQVVAHFHWEQTQGHPCIKFTCGPNIRKSLQSHLSANDQPCRPCWFPHSSASASSSAHPTRLSTLVQCLFARVFVHMRCSCMHS